MNFHEPKASLYSRVFVNVAGGLSLLSVAAACVYLAVSRVQIDARQQTLLEQSENTFRSR